MTLAYREEKLRRVRGMQSRATHLALAWIVLTCAGLYAGVGLRRFIIGILFLCAANGLFVWGLALHRRAQRLLKLYL